jgi:hypothetical protein
MSDHLLPLEKRLEEFAKSRKDEFPDQHDSYWNRYINLLSSLKSHIYPNINAGLACLSKSPGIYTDHGERHFDEVVRYAGFLIEDTFNQQSSSLSPYELYLLLCAIRVHDAGNIDGREGHETEASAILMKYGGLISLDTAELSLIAEIAQAHGGKTFDDDKDTIGKTVPEQTIAGGVDVRPQLVAALVRFADEICEHSVRASTHHVNAGTLPEENKLFHFYAKSIVGAKPDRKNKAFKLQIKFDITLLNDKYLTPKDAEGNQTSKYLIDDVWGRIDKLNHERVYCNRFLLPSMQTDRLEISVAFTKKISVGGAEVITTCERHDLTIRDEGYPDVANAWRSKVDGMGMDGDGLSGKVW